MIREPFDEARYRTLVEDADSAAQEERYSLAVSLYSQAIAIYPKVPEIYASRGSARCFLLDVLFCCHLKSTFSAFYSLMVQSRMHRAVLKPLQAYPKPI